MEAVSVDTTFLIDLQREVARRSTGVVGKFLESYAGTDFGFGLVVWGEFQAGFADPDCEALREIRRRFRYFETDEKVGEWYGRIFRQLKEKGRLVGSNDMWIAASALRHQVPLVTRNVNEFRLVPNLRVIGY
jgi:predicted nucleic acid-binding protein